MDQKNQLSAARGTVCRQSGRLYLEVNGKRYQIHLWDVEKYAPKPKSLAEGVLFNFKHPVPEGNRWVHGWVYPGTLKPIEELDRRRGAGSTDRSFQKPEDGEQEEEEEEG